METLFVELGYVPEDDSWETDGRRTYSHEDEADANQIRLLQQTLPADWKLRTTVLRTFVNEAENELIELEPGGADCTGHLLHHMRMQDA